MIKFSVSSLWSGLPEEIAAELTANAPCHQLGAGDVLFRAGDKGKGCYRLDKGLLKVSLASPQGDERIIAILSEGSIVGDLAVIDGLPRSASVVALTDCKLCFISRASFQRCVERHPETYEFLVRLLAQRLRETDDTILALAFLTAKGRVAYALLELAEAVGKKIHSSRIVIPAVLSQKDLAAFAGVSRENVNRVLRNWARSKLVVKSAKSYDINDVTRLKRELGWEK